MRVVRRVLPGRREVPVAMGERLLVELARGPERFSEMARWLLVDPEWARLLFPRVEEPSGVEVAEWLRWLQREAPECLVVGQVLVGESRWSEEVFLEFVVDRLLKVSGWEHPAEVISEPLEDYSKLLEVCKGRLRREGSWGDRGRLQAIVHKVDRAARIAEGARVRREKLAAAEEARAEEVVAAE